MRANSSCSPKMHWFDCANYRNVVCVFRDLHRHLGGAEMWNSSQSAELYSATRQMTSALLMRRPSGRNTSCGKTCQPSGSPLRDFRVSRKHNIMGGADSFMGSTFLYQDATRNYSVRGGCGFPSVHISSAHGRSCRFAEQRFCE